MAEGESETLIESDGKARPGQKRKAGTAPGKMRVTDSKTPRYVFDLWQSFPHADVLSVSSNLCVRAWKEQHPNGLTDAYEKYWNELNDADRMVNQLQYLLSVGGVFDSVC